MLKKVAVIIAATALFSWQGAEAAGAKDTPYYNLAVGGWGMDDTRVSLWPLAYHDSKSTSVIWPFFSTSDDYLGLCPLYSQRGRRGVDEFSLLWPFCQHDFKTGRGWAFPFIWTPDMFTIFPIFWNDPDGTTVFPLGGHHVLGRNETYWAACGLAGCSFADGGLTDAWLFPAFYASPDEFVSLPYYSFRGKGRDCEGLLAGMIGWTSDGDGLDSCWTLPLFYWSDELFLSLPFSCTENGWTTALLAGAAGDTNWLLPLYLKTKQWLHTPLFSWATDGSDRYFSLPLLSYAERDRMTFLLGLAGHRADRGWIFPLYYREDNDDEDVFLSLPYAQFGQTWLAGLGLAGSTEHAHWCLPLYLKTQDWLHTPLLSWSLDDSQAFFSLPLLTWTDRDEATILMGLAGIRQDCNWVAPLYYWDSERFVSIPYIQSSRGWVAGLGLAGSVNSAHWLLPLFIQNEDSFLSLFYGQTHRRDDSTLVILPWALSGITWDAEGRLDSYRALLFLAGHETKSSGEFREWCVPLYYRTERDFYSLPYCSYIDDETETTLWASFLVGTRSGRRNGFWAFPFVGTETDARFEAVRKRVDAPSLPDDLAYRTHTLTNGAGTVVQVKRPVVSREAVKDSLTTLVGIRTESVSDAYSGKMRQWYHILDRTSWITPFLWHADETREVIFNVDTRKKRGERHRSETSVLGFVYRSKESSDTTTGDSSSDSSVLWRAWKRTEKYGAVSTDIFPGITCDTRKDGSTKTSFLWKVFNYETDAKGKSHLDLFFIPCW